MPEMFANIEKETNGAVKWKLIPGGQIADGKTTFSAVKDGLMQAGLGIVPYVPNSIPSVYAIYSTLIFGEDDVVAATGAALETIYQHCPSCLDEFRNFNAVGLGGWTSSAYFLACREPIKTLAELKGWCLTLLTSRARRASPTSGSGVADTARLSLRRPLCVRRGSQGLQNRNRPLPHHTAGQST